MTMENVFGKLVRVLRFLGYTSAFCMTQGFCQKQVLSENTASMASFSFCLAGNMGGKNVVTPYSPLYKSCSYCCGVFA